MTRSNAFTPTFLRWTLAILVCSVLSALVISHYRETPPQALRMSREDTDWLAQAPYWPMALEAIRQGQYREAAVRLDQHLADHPRHTEAIYQLALVCMEIGREEQAVGLLDQVRINDAEYYPEATWHLALARLRQGHLLEGRILLSELQEGEDALMREKARVMLEELLPEITPM